MMDYKILLADLVNDFTGHFYIMKALHRLKNADMVDTRETKLSIKRHPIKGILERIRMVKRVMRYADNTDGFKVVHFLTADKFYWLPYFHRLDRRNLKVVATIHKFPSNSILKTLLRNYAKKISKVVVLTNSLKEEMGKIGIDNVEVIRHPGFHNYSAVTKSLAKEKLNINTSKQVISLLGGTRYDKGLDIFIEATKLLTQNDCEKLFVNIVGRPQDFDSDYINHNLPPKLDRKITLENVSDEEFRDNVMVSDWIAVPYRKSFNGISGPMVEGLSQGIPAIVPADSSLSRFSKDFGCLEFTSEDPSSLALRLSEIAKGRNVSVRNVEWLTVEKFIDSHKKLYDSLYSDCY
jgi:hypothetical protein